MKKIIALVITVLIVAAVFTACKTPPPPPPPPPPVTEDIPNDAAPEITVTIPELFSPDPDIVDDKITIGIEINHPVDIKDWHIEIQPSRLANQQTQRQNTTEGTQRQRRQTRTEEQREGGQARRRVFFEQNGTGTPPAAWQWDGKGTSGEMVQSATDYRFTLSVNDINDNHSSYEGTIAVDVLVRREGDVLRIIVPSIVFPPDSADFSRLSDEDRRSNTRILRLIANALNKYSDYRILVEGHANPTTPPGTTQRTNEEAGSRTVVGLRPLSEARAKSVVDSLVANNGIAETRLTVTGMGGTRTVAAYDDDEENWKNRRVEFILQR